MDKKYIEWFISEIPQLVGGRIISGRVANSLKAHYLRRLEELEKAENPQVEEKSLRPEFSELTIPANTPEPVVQISDPAPKSEPEPKPEITQPVEVHKNKKVSKLSVSVILTVIAGVLISFGIISLIAYNWAAIPRMIKAVTAILLLLATQSVGLFLLKTGRTESVKIRESYSLFWALLFGGIVAFVSQIFKFQISSTTFMLLWTVSTILITYLFSAHTTFFLSMLFTLIFICFSWKSKSFAFVYPLIASLYFPARKKTFKYIPVFILGIAIFLLRLILIDVPDNVKVMLIVTAFSSAAFLFFQKKRKIEIGAILLPLATLISLTNAIPRFYVSLPLNTAEIIMIGIIIFGFFTEGAIIPFFKKFKNKENISLDNLIYLSPIVLGLNSLFIKNSEILLKTNALKSYLIFTSPLTLVLIFISVLFVISFLKNQNRTWAFLSCIILIFIKSFVCEHAPSMMYLTSEIFVFLFTLALYKETFISKSENIYIIPVARAVTGILFFITLLSGLFGNYGFTASSKIPYNIVLCFIPQVIFSCVLFGKYIKNDLKKFLSILDIPVILVFITILIAVSNSKNIDVLKLAVKIISSMLFIYSLIVSIKFEKFTFLIYSGIIGIYLLLELVSRSDIFTIFYFVCMLLFFITGLFLWKNKFEINSENKNFLIIIRIVAVIILFITNIMANHSDSVLYYNNGIDKFTFFTFTPLAISGLVLFGIFSAKNLRAFLLNVDIIITLTITSVLFCTADISYQDNILFILGFITALNLIMSCIYIIRIEKFEYIFYVLFSILYFTYPFSSIDYFITILFMLSTVALFISGLFLWKEKFTPGEGTKTVFVISRMLSLALLFAITKMLNDFYFIEFLIRSKIAKYILATFAPAAIFGLVNFAIFAKKDFKNFILNLDIVINLFLTAVILLITSKSTGSVLAITSKTLMILNMLTACIYFFVFNKKSCIANLIIAIVYYAFSQSNANFSEIFFMLSTVALFISGLFLWKEKFTLGANTKKVFIISRMLSLALLFTITIMANNYYYIAYIIRSKPAYYILATFAPAAIFGLVNFAIFAKKDFKNFISNLDIVINHFMISVILIIVSRETENAVAVTSETIIILNMLAACIFLFVFHKKSYIANLIIATVYYAISHSDASYLDNTAASFWFFVTLVTILIHFYAQTKGKKLLKVLSALIPGFLIFYFTSISPNFESHNRSMYLNYYILSYMIVSGATAVYLLVHLIKEKILFNPSIFAFPPSILLLSKVSDKVSIAITFPLLLVFCVYYFYLAYKNDSLKIANLSTVYFGLILMIRFFTSGYGLAVQGITLILMGILLIIMNIMMTKRRARND